MLKKFCVLAALLVVAACASSQPKTFTGQFQPPPAGSRVLVMTPDVQLSLLTAAGMQQPREDWSRTARDALANAVAAHVQTEGHITSTLDPATAMDGRVGQIIRLHDAVGTSILNINYYNVNIPTRRENFAWTLGEGVQEVGGAHNADYALFITARGTWSSSARMVMAIVAAGPTGAGQTAFASLVDLRTGNVIWFNVAQAAPNEDMREPEGAAAFARRLMQEAPL